jgi:cytochrome o ubiquinol oxidase subunit 2
MADHAWWQMGVLDPQGVIGHAEHTILFNATIVMLGIIGPVIVLTLIFAAWYRASNGRAVYWPNWNYSGSIEVVIWSVPTLIILFLGGMAWIGSHDLDPGRGLTAPARTITIEIVSLDWKWLFIYPDQGIASVNQLVIPANTPVQFRLTSATVMNSFFVPQLGSQIYTMAGMVTTLNLVADRPGTYPGISAQFSGDGFSDMTFKVQAVPDAQFRQWLQSAHQANKPLDSAAFQALAHQPGKIDPIVYSAIDGALFSDVVATAGQSALTPQPEGPIVRPKMDGS